MTDGPEAASAPADAGESGALDAALRKRLLEDPGLILGDRDLMRALVAAHEGAMGGNVVDIRGRAMDALEYRLDRLETQHQSVISAAYENQAGTNTIHRAVLAMLEPEDFGAFLEALTTTVAPILRVDTLHLVMETARAEGLSASGDALVMAPRGAIAEMVTAGRKAPRGDDIVLRRAAEETRAVHRREVASEALIPLDLGPGRHGALLLMGSRDTARFTPAQGTDLLRFLAQVFRLVLLGWLRE